MSTHNCKALVFRCMDFRIRLAKLSEMLQAERYNEGDYDLVSLAGSAKPCLSAVPEEAGLVLKQVELSQKLHGIHEVVILYHDNCGAYGIADPAEEANVQTNDLATISALIKAKFPELNVSAYIIKGVAEDNLHLEKLEQAAI